MCEGNRKSSRTSRLPSMSYALSTIWYERQRFLPAILAVAFSAILIAVQGGLLLGLFSTVSVPIDRARADLWVGYPGVRSVDLGRPIPERWVSRVAAQPEVERVEPCSVGFALWAKITPPGTPPGTPEVVTVVGTRLGTESLGAVEYLRQRPDLMARLAEPFTVVVDEAELGRLGVRRIGNQAEVTGRRVRVVGIIRGYTSISGPYVFCSLDTARVLLREPPAGATYLLARCRTPGEAAAVAQRLQRYERMSAFTAEEFSTRSRVYWLLTSKAGVAVGFAAMLGLVVGAVVTGQTLYSATAASRREFATLRAMGIPRWRLKMTVVEQSFWVGLCGVLVAAPFALVLAEAGNRAGTRVWLHPYVMLAAAAITMVMALAAGLAALRSFQGVDPAENIR
jgi:putative ABC transport system permease protein